MRPSSLRRRTSPDGRWLLTLLTLDSEVARAFVLRQEARHEADYDHTADLAEADAISAIAPAAGGQGHEPLERAAHPR